jgi:pre-mRNA-processing factor 19
MKYQQNEWDEVMLETFSLKQALDTTRQELSYSLYKSDAAHRMIARIMRERDEALHKLSQLQSSNSVTNGHSGTK